MGRTEIFPDNALNEKAQPINIKKRKAIIPLPVRETG
jgi:hypothetical protein